MIRVMLPSHLQSLARTGRTVDLEVVGAATPQSVIAALEASYPALRGNIRDAQTHKRRPMVRFFVCEQDISHDPPDTPLPEKVVAGDEPFIILGAISGG